MKDGFVEAAYREYSFELWGATSAGGRYVGCFKATAEGKEPGAGETAELFDERRDACAAARLLAEAWVDSHLPRD